MRDGETVWDGVTNPTAVKHLREMKPGTKWIFYHTGDERTAVGTGTVISVDASDPKVPIVRVKAGKRLKQPKTLAQIKAEKLFAHSPLADDRPALRRPADPRAVGLVDRFQRHQSRCTAEHVHRVLPQGKSHLPRLNAKARLLWFAQLIPASLRATSPSGHTVFP